ncbi:MAG: Phenylalanine--tRNA ligase alpha subunit [Myxococcota bacterium]|nr:Phenylalanine--tRNA ligase alpha subunit [Myxococcota bacterium]
MSQETKAALASLDELRDWTRKSLAGASDPAAVANIKAALFGRKAGKVNDLMKLLASLPNEEKKTFGQAVNTLKDELTAMIDAAAGALDAAARDAALRSRAVDITLPGRRMHDGHPHPLTDTLETLTGIFSRMGFHVRTGPHIEFEKYNFDLLNIAADHPARDMHDTFWMWDGVVLRTHTSPVQIRAMLKEKPPLRIIAPGAVFRCDHDATHSPMFHQVEGLLVDRHVTFADLKGTLGVFARECFGAATAVRFRASYFPFTEPSAEMDIQCVNCGGRGCNVCKQTGWLEILGCGMVHPNVLRSCDIDPDRYTGFAFGMGVERITMLRFGVNDLRLFFDNDLRMLRQF